MVIEHPCHASENLGGLGAEPPITLLPKNKIRDFVLSLDRADADAIIICSTAIRAMETIEEIENIAGKPVLCSNQMGIWDALRSAGISDRIEGYGSLLRDY